MARSELEKLKKASKINSLQRLNAAESTDFAGGLLIYNPKGTGALRLVGGTGSDRHSYEILTYKKRAVLAMRSKKTLFDEESEKETALCTPLSVICGKKRLVKDGVRETDPEKMMYYASPLINALYPSLYLVVKKDLYPAAGDGRYFHEQGTAFRTEPSSVSLYMRSKDPDHMLSYILPAEPEIKDTVNLNEEMLAFGKGKETLSVVLSLGNGVNVLIDGHARAAAAAMLGKKLPCLCIVPVARFFTKGFNKYVLEFASLTATVKELPKKYGGFFLDKDCDQPVKYIEKLLSERDPVFDGRPLGEMSGISYPDINETLSEK